jgi:phosphoheptose isomerase
MSDKRTPDPRFKNRVFEGKSVSEYFGNYSNEISECLSRVSRPALERAMLILRHTIDAGNEIFVAGNGGSSAIAEHLICDFTKGTYVSQEKRVKVTSLTSNVPLFTALANDCGYEHVFSRQLEFKAKHGDVLILVSSSGNSPNIVKSAEFAKANGIMTIGFTGFDGGRLAQICDVSIHIDIANYGIVEDCHHMLMHTFSQFLAKLHDQQRSEEEQNSEPKRKSSSG